MRAVARLGLVAALLAALLVSGFAPVGARGAAACEVFPETGVRVCDPFLSYWQANGGLAQQGFPITRAFMELNPADGKVYQVQYFERARFEHHPENEAPYDVLLGLIGNEQFFPKYPGPPPPVVGDPFPGHTGGQDCDLFPLTDELVCGPFLAYWQEHGGLAQQGYPISPVLLETNPIDGKQYPTQYFERARFEFHPEQANGLYAVQLGLLGREQLLARYPHWDPADPAAFFPYPTAITPASGPAGTQFTLTATGLPGGTPLTLYLYRDGVSMPSTREYILTPSASTLAVTIFSARFVPGTYRVFVSVGDDAFAGSATFVVTAEPQQLAVAITPESGPSGTIFLAKATGLPPGATIGVRTGTADGKFTVGTQARLRPDETVYQLSLGSPDQEPGTYFFSVTTPDGRVTSANYVVTAPPHAPPPGATGPLEVSVTPQIGPPGTSFKVRVSGLAPGSEIRVEYLRAGRVALGITDTLEPDQTDYITIFDSSGADPDTYGFRFTTADGRTGSVETIVTYTLP